MSAKTGIQWTDATWNPTVGCTQVSPGCAACYAKTLHDMRHKAYLEGKPMAPQYSVPFETVQMKPERLAVPLSWRKSKRIFVNSVSDLFHEDVPHWFIDDVFQIMLRRPDHTFQVLTKRPDRMLEWAFSTNARFGDIMGAHTGAVPSHPRNIHLGITVENQRFANERIPLLLQMPAAVRWISYEPALGAVDWSKVPMGGKGINWIVSGGETGSERPTHPDWHRATRDACAATDVPYFFKQWGDWAVTYDCDDDPDARQLGQALYKAPSTKGDRYVGQWLNLAGGQGFHGDRVVRVKRVGVKKAGRLLDGVEHNAFPVAP